MKNTLKKGFAVGTSNSKIILFNQLLEPGNEINVLFYPSNITSVQGTNPFFRQSLTCQFPSSAHSR